MPIPYAPPWLLKALAEWGVKEVPGPGSASRILEYHAATSLKAQSDDVPWCAAFVGWCLKGSGIPSTESAAAASYLNYGKQLVEPELGAIVVIKRGPEMAPGYKGMRPAHVFFFIDRHDGLVYGWGGNQGNRVGLMAFQEDRVLGYRWPGQTVASAVARS